MNVLIRRLGRQMLLKTFVHNDVEYKDRPLLIMFSWLKASRRQLQKYEDLYIARGFNVLTFQITPIEIFQCIKVKGMISDMVRFLSDETQGMHYQSIVLKGFSVGGQVIGVLHYELESKDSNVKERIVAQIFDSPAVDFQLVPQGISETIGGTRATKIITKSLARLYLCMICRLSDRTNTQYINPTLSLKLNSGKVPSLFFYSKNDTIVPADVIEEIIDEFKKNGVDVYFTCWENDAHVTHFKNYQDTYIKSLDAFLGKIKTHS